MTTLEVVERYLELLGVATSPAEIAALFADDVDFRISGDVASVPWIDIDPGRAGVEGFFVRLRELTDPIAFVVDRRVIDGDSAVLFGNLQTRVRRTGKVIQSEFAIDMIVRDGEIVRYRLFEDSFAVSQAARD